MTYLLFFASITQSKHKGYTIKEIVIVKYVSLKHEASITELEGSVFVFENKDANGNTHITRFKSLKDAIARYERVFNTKVDVFAEWDLEFDCIFYD